MFGVGLSPNNERLLARSLERVGLRPTRQREEVFAVLLAERDHPTAEEVLNRVREGMGGTSLATVYNCLETLVACGLVRQVNYEREPTRYCPNLDEHAHFHDSETGQVFDVALPDDLLPRLKAQLPEGYEAQRVDIYFHGRRQTGGPARG